MNMSSFELIQELLKEQDVECKRNFLLSEFSPIKIGGRAALVALPKTAEQIVKAVRTLRHSGVRYKIVGKMSNLLPSDNAYDGVIVKCDGVRHFSISECTLTAECGFSFLTHRRVLLECNLGGYEELSGIPGCIGGMICMNAGAYGVEICDLLQKVTVYDVERDRIRVISPSELGFSYRTSSIRERGYIVLSAEFLLESKNAESVRQKIGEYAKKRRATQPLEYPNLGSTFKRPNNGYAASLIERCGLKGFSIGGAQVSEKHAGFIINRGGATSEDVKHLIRTVQQRVESTLGVRLEPEIEFI